MLVGGAEGAQDRIVGIVLAIFVAAPHAAVVLDPIQRPFQQRAQLALEAGAGNVGFLSEGMLDHGQIQAADFDGVLARADVQTAA